MLCAITITSYPMSSIDIWYNVCFVNTLSHNNNFIEIIYRAAKLFYTWIMYVIYFWRFSTQTTNPGQSYKYWINSSQFALKEPFTFERPLLISLTNWKFRKCQIFTFRNFVIGFIILLISRLTFRSFLNDESKIIGFPDHEVTAPFSLNLTFKCPRYFAYA